MRCAIEHFSDRLNDALRQSGAPVCVGLDPVWERLPASLRGGTAKPSAAEAAEAFTKFSLGVLEAVRPFARCVKPQSACYERYLWPGVKAYHDVVVAAQKMGFIVIGDGKRGDIGISAEHYAAGCLADTSFADLHSPTGPDALTINAYLGDDGIQPFIDVAKKQGKGLFALVRTSNPGGDAIQGLTLADGRTVGEAVGGVVARLGSAEGCVGKGGYSLLGAVVGATKPRDAVRLREIMKQQIFLVPGFGAQGGSADDVKPCFHADGSGAVITASRSVLFAYDKKPTDVDWRTYVATAAREMRDQVGAIVGWK